MEIRAKIKFLKNTLQEIVVNSIKSLFLVKADDRCRQLFMFSEINRILKEKKIFEYTPSQDTASLNLTEDIWENLAYAIRQGFCRYLIIKVQERDRSPIFE